VQFALAKIRKAARELLTLDEKDPRRVFEGPALLRRCVRAGLLEQDKAELDFVLQLTTQKLLERRLQVREGGHCVWRWGGRRVEEREAAVKVACTYPCHAWQFRLAGGLD